LSSLKATVEVMLYFWWWNWRNMRINI